ncbi:hypothetical protein XELAEV_18038440mg [Xenopus laevis]|uniref:Uncharacterized protein n=1 Tax=Xenopus laevis TaxID=8355 RepID=A0A974H6Z3_XENLA|nr:hypothetical protein XELAEV_18038440mg [Xenopus laevis]
MVGTICSQMLSIHYPSYIFAPLELSTEFCNSGKQLFIGVKQKVICTIVIASLFGSVYIFDHLQCSISN